MRVKDGRRCRDLHDAYRRVDAKCSLAPPRGHQLQLAWARSPARRRRARRRSARHHSTSTPPGSSRPGDLRGAIRAGPLNRPVFGMYLLIDEFASLQTWIAAASTREHRSSTRDDLCWVTLLVRWSAIPTVSKRPREGGAIVGEAAMGKSASDGGSAPAVVIRPSGPPSSPSWSALCRRSRRCGAVTPAAGKTGGGPPPPLSTSKPFSSSRYPRPARAVLCSRVRACHHRAAAGRGRLARRW